MTTMSKDTIMALKEMMNHRGVAGKVMAIQGICDMVEEYVGVHRDIFRRELVQSGAIKHGALLMLIKTINTTNQQPLELTAEEEAYYEMCAANDAEHNAEMDAHYLANMEADEQYEIELDRFRGSRW